MTNMLSLKLNKKIFFMLYLLIMMPMGFANNNHLLAGVWFSACAKGDDGGFTMETFHFSQNSAVYSTMTYTDAACTKLVKTLATYRTFKVGDTVKGLANVYKLDYIFKSVTMAYYSPAAVVAANKAPGDYGFTNWVINRPKEVSGLRSTKASDPEKARGEKFFTIVKITKKAIYMGYIGDNDLLTGAGTSDAKRLSVIYDSPFLKQPLAH